MQKNGLQLFICAAVYFIAAERIFIDVIQKVWIEENIGITADFPYDPITRSGFCICRWT